jgi:hypothetical protein
VDSLTLKLWNISDSLKSLYLISLPKPNLRKPRPSLIPDQNSTPVDYSPCSNSTKSYQENANPANKTAINFLTPFFDSLLAIADLAKPEVYQQYQLDLFCKKTLKHNSILLLLWLNHQTKLPLLSLTKPNFCLIQLLRPTLY